MTRLLLITFTSLILFNCGGDKAILNQESYEGPALIMDTIVTKYSDNGLVKFVLRSPREEKFDNGDKSWPHGMNLEIYDEVTRDITTTFVADKVSYDKKEDLYKGEGNVNVINVSTKEKLTTEELFWDPNEKIFYTEKFVTIIDEDGLPTYGEGLSAKQDFSEYEILRAIGEKELGQGFN